MLRGSQSENIAVKQYSLVLQIFRVFADRFPCFAACSLVVDIGLCGGISCGSLWCVSSCTVNVLVIEILLLPGV